MFFKRIHKNINYLELTPYRLQEFEETKDGKINLLFPKFKIELFNFFIPRNKSKKIKIKLDDYGSQVWKLIDGKNNVNDIVLYIFEKYEDDLKPEEERITKFLTTLYQHKFIAFKEFDK